jgi:hypothetical protein
MPSFGRKLTSGFQTIGRKLKKIDGQTIGRKVTNTASKVDGVVQRVGGIAMLVEPKLAPAIGSGMALSHATNAAVQSGAALAKKKGDNSAEIERFAADYGHAKSQYGQMGQRNGLERMPIRSTEPVFDFA